jgi:hypothetical protein
MKVHAVLLALGLSAVAAAAPGTASALPVSEGAAHALCKGWWTHHMATHTSNCAYCEKDAAGKPVCHFFACDEGGCDYVIVARRVPKGRWQTFAPRVSRTVR